MVKLQSLALLSLASTALAAPSWWEQWSLNKHSSPSPIPGSVVAWDADRRLVQTSAEKAPFWTTEEDRLHMLRKNIKYMDVTNNQDLGQERVQSVRLNPLPEAAVHQDKVARYIDQLSTANMEVALTKFTSFNTRYYKSETGHDSAQWLYKQISDLIENTEAESDISIRKFDHPWKQFSIIARFEGKSEALSNQPIIVGAHQDSVNMWLPQWGRSPGADDDGSGTITILEIFRALVNTGFRPQRPVEFHWYSAEEAGLLGSQAVAQSYEKKGVDVLAMIQNDMTGYVGTKFAESYGIVTDYVDKELTDLIQVFAAEYGDIPVRQTKCGYACSDHASWAKAGYRSAFAIEGDFSDSSPYIHSSSDDVSHINFDHMKQFAKLSLGFAVELGYYKGEALA
ncbi:bacterial leucyl aminopeptidase [Entomortierella parvispora]|uniref:Peptide hydrolase n=1 Tax=Entomortierella parvispora TaxID=205924 RepID=A0A9P3LYV4_9FUNG|nr:bacterial leucyl aminopeptidase [Entomortierella parvispora]